MGERMCHVLSTRPGNARRLLVGSMGRGPDSLGAGVSTGFDGGGRRPGRPVLTPWASGPSVVSPLRPASPDQATAESSPSMSPSSSTSSPMGESSEESSDEAGSEASEEAWASVASTAWARVWRTS